MTEDSLLVAFFIGALGEELGWSGYAIDPLQDRFGAFRDALLLGVVWAVLHYVPLLETHRIPQSEIDSQVLWLKQTLLLK